MSIFRYCSMVIRAKEITTRFSAHPMISWYSRTTYENLTGKHLRYSPCSLLLYCQHFFCCLYSLLISLQLRVMKSIWMRMEIQMVNIFEMSSFEIYSTIKISRYIGPTLRIQRQVYKSLFSNESPKETCMISMVTSNFRSSCSIYLPLKKYKWAPSPVTHSLR
jgi:hypothetical protein